MNFKTLALHEEAGVLAVTIGNPPINLMTAQMVQELFQLSGWLMQDRNIKVVTLESADPDFFIAHFDLDELEGAATDPSKASRYPDINVLQSVALAWQMLPQITIAKIDGRLRGGGLEFVLALDMRFATQDSLFCFPEASGHFLAAGGGATRTFLAAGPARGLEFLLSSRDFTATEAERYGLINRALAADEFEPYVADLVTRLNARTPAVVAMHQTVLRRITSPVVEAVFASLAAENEGFMQAFEDGKLQAAARQLSVMGQTRETELDLPATIASLPN